MLPYLFEDLVVRNMSDIPLKLRQTVPPYILYYKEEGTVLNRCLYLMKVMFQGCLSDSVS